MEKKIVALAGDGIGEEIMNASLEVLKAIETKTNYTFKIEKLDVGGAGIDNQGTPLPQETVEKSKEADAILLGAIGGPKWDDAPVRPEQGLLKLRQELGLFANIRPTKVNKSLMSFSPIKEEIVEGTDFVMVRELTGGIYFGEPRELSEDQALDTCVYKRSEIERIIRMAFEIAKGRRKKVTSIDKSNVLATSKLWRRVADEVAKDYPDITLEHQLVDSAAMILIQQPTQFDVIVTENMFGDILSDEASVITGTLGVQPSASHGQAGPSLYEPIHGSAPDIANQNIANPVSMILSVAMMLRQSFDLEAEASMIEEICEEVIAEGTRTKDLNGTATTTEFTEKVVAKINQR